MSEIDVSKCEYKCGIDCHIRAYPILNCADVKIEDCHYKQLQLLKVERDFFLNQLVVLDGEDATVQITQEQFDEYNKLKAENEELKRLIAKQKNAKIQLSKLKEIAEKEIENNKYNSNSPFFKISEIIEGKNENQSNKIR